MEIFQAGKGVNANKLNANFDEAKQDANANETALNQIASTALLKDGSNLTQEVIDKFNQETPEILNTQGEISLQDNKVYYITLTGAGSINLPTIPQDQFSHTIVLFVNSPQFSLDLGTDKNYGFIYELPEDKPYSVIYIYNKIDNQWYYNIA